MDNLRGALLMTLAMAGFALEDMFIKLMAGAMPTWQIILLLGGGGAAVFAIVATSQRQALFSRAFLTGPVLLRSLGELVGTIGFVTALALTPISSASAILQATPLAVTLGAALFLGETVGWRRWSAILAGFVGVILVIRPGMSGFEPNSLFALLAVVGLGMRDLVTRKVRGEVTSLQLSYLAFLTLIPASVILASVSDRAWVAPEPQMWALVGAAVLGGTLAYYAIVAAMRIGEVSYVTPFRYSRMIFALIVGIVVFGETPDAMMLIGAAIIISSGIYTVWRERKLSLAA